MADSARMCTRAALTGHSVGYLEKRNEAGREMHQMRVRGAKGRG